MGVFTLSLDCEGLWGMADKPAVVANGKINDQSLASAYRTVNETLSAHDIRATAAFVSAFDVRPEALFEMRPLLTELAARAPRWFAAPLRAMEERDLDGWTGHAYHDAMRAAGHEMGWHGATHLALDEATSDAAVGIELELAQKLFGALGYAPKSVVYPRNLIGHQSRLRAAGFTTYRAAPDVSLRGRVSNLVQEFHLFDRRVSEQPRRDGDWNVSPSG